MERATDRTQGIAAGVEDDLCSDGAAEAMNIFMLALCAWRENDEGGQSGMQSVINVVMNRSKARGTSPYQEVVLPWQFSSITAPGDPGLLRWPSPSDPMWQLAQTLAQSAVQGTLPDITGGATSYYAANMTEPPKWAAQMRKTVEIAGQIFFTDA